jgi:hypothetical protein
MTISGEVDQSAGVFVRFRSAVDYYAVRANAFENNVILAQVVIIRGLASEPPGSDPNGS